MYHGQAGVLQATQSGGVRHVGMQDSQGGFLSLAIEVEAPADGCSFTPWHASKGKQETNHHSSSADSIDRW